MTARRAVPRLPTVLAHAIHYLVWWGQCSYRMSSSSSPRGCQKWSDLRQARLRARWPIALLRVFSLPSRVEKGEPYLKVPCGLSQPVENGHELLRLRSPVPDAVLAGVVGVLPEPFKVVAVQKRPHAFRESAFVVHRGQSHMQVRHDVTVRRSERRDNRAPDAHGVEDLVGQPNAIVLVGRVYHGHNDVRLAHNELGFFGGDVSEELNIGRQVPDLEPVVETVRGPRSSDHESSVDAPHSLYHLFDEPTLVKTAEIAKLSLTEGREDR